MKLTKWYDKNVVTQNSNFLRGTHSNTAQLNPKLIICLELANWYTKVGRVVDDNTKRRTEKKKKCKIRDFSAIQNLREIDFVIL